MKVLVVSFNDGDNMAIENVLYELKTRGHEITIFARYQDENSIRMFHGLGAKIRSFKELTSDIAKEYDVAFCSVNMMIHLKYLDIYIFVYSQYFKEFFMTDGADFLFTYRNGAMPRCDYHCASMQVGDSKDDHPAIKATRVTKRLLYIDTGHLPFGKKGKTQIADMLLEICQKFPDYELCIKPRWLRAQNVNYTHKNTEHLYTVIEERCNGQLPDNLNMLNEHRNMQELIDSSDTVITPYTTAIADVILRNKPLIVVSGWDCEDKWDARYTDIAYQHDFFAESGCMVDYREVTNYLPYGLQAKQSFADLFMGGASKRIADVMEYVYDKFLSRGIYPEAIDYNYENYREIMRSDPLTTMASLKQERVRDILQQIIARFSYMLAAPVNFTRYYEELNRTYKRCPLTAGGFESFRAHFEKLKNLILIENAELLSKNEIDQSFLLQALYDTGCENEILKMPIKEVLCTSPYHYFMGMIFSKRNMPQLAQQHFCTFLKEANSRAYDKYRQEGDQFIGQAYNYIFETFNLSNIDPLDFADLLIDFYGKYQITITSPKNRIRIHNMLPQFAEQLEEICPERAIKCLQLYAKWEYHYNIKDRDKLIKSLRRDIKNLQNSKYYYLSQKIAQGRQKINNGIKCLQEHGIYYTLKQIINKKITPFIRKVQDQSFYKIWSAFHKRVLKGYVLYSSFVQKYGENAQLLIPAGALGDTYIFGQCFEAYAKRKYPDRVPVFAVFGKGGSEVAKILEIKHFEIFSLEEFQIGWNSLLMFDIQSMIHAESMFFHTAGRHTLILMQLEGIHGLNYLTDNMAQLGLLDGHFKLRNPKFNQDPALLDRLFSESHLQPGKTVVLAPYAKMQKSLPSTFWLELAEQLQSFGLSVCTNSSGKHEPPVPKTLPVFIPISSLVPFLENAGAIVGLRSGLLDVSSSAKCIQISIHPRNDFKRSKLCNVYDYYAISEMYGQPGQYDIPYTSTETKQIIDRIVRIVTKDLGVGINEGP